jgi:uncharacterized protein
MHNLGFSNLRVRLHGNIARIELIPEELEKAVSIRARIVELLRIAAFLILPSTLKDIEAVVWMRCYEN